MWRSNFVNYLTVILTLAILYQGVKAQNGFSDIYDSYIRNHRDFNNLEQITEDNGYGNLIGSYIPQTPPSFPYDYYERPNPAWSDYYMNQYYPTNQQWGYQYDPFYQQQQTYPYYEPNQPYKAPSSGSPEYTINSRFTDYSTVRKSEQKCEEYSRPVTQVTQVTSLSLFPSTMKIKTPICKYSTALIVGGEITNSGEFPHMAAIGFKVGNKVSWKFGGSLISEYFVLTAAHCTLFSGVRPNVIRLGEQNLVRDDDRAQPHDFGIANIIKHPKYTQNSDYNDIALLRLNQNVVFTKYIRPACLWQNDIINTKTAVATGWGSVEFGGASSNDLRKVSLDIIDNNECRQLYQPSTSLKNGIVSSQMCAGHPKENRDTCQGDSGGPIQVVKDSNKCIFYIVGITSFGQACAIRHGVYTRVSSYLDWIEENVWP